VLLNSFARFTPAPDYPWGWAPEALSLTVDTMERQWGQGLFVASMLPHLAADPEFRRFAARMERYSASPKGIAAVTRLLAEIDVRQVLDVIDVPTLVLHRTEHALTDVHHGRYLASRIRDAKLVELPGPAGHWDDAPEEVEEVEEFLTGTRHPPESDRVLATVLFTDVVASTEQAVRRGDQQWRGLLDRLYAGARREVERHRGKLIKTTGDGVLATFDGPGRAIRCGLALRDAVSALGIEVRVGLHAGEVEVMGDDVAGIAVHIAARVMGEAGAAEVLVSSSVPPLVAGSGLEFADRGEQHLKGVPGRWRLFSVEG
jgi:class 3 adenylate cyclase